MKIHHLTILGWFVYILSLAACTTDEKKENIDPWTGLWRCEMELVPQERYLPFFLEIIPGNKGYSAAIYNGDESIVHDDVIVRADSIIITSPYFQSTLHLVRSENELTGYWQDYSRGDNYIIPVKAKYNLNQRFSFELIPNDSIDGRWSVWFGSDSSGYPAVGEFETDKNSTKGTFLTETGDYRFLEGGFGGNTLKLSAFDGSHAFLFEARVINDTLVGKFFSGNHYMDSFKAWRNDSAILSDPYTRVQTLSGKPLTFSAKTLEGDTFQFSGGTDNKAYLIQVMGSWCPNCLDECAYLSSRYTDLKNMGIEIIAVSFERLPFEQSRVAIDRLRTNLDIPYKILYGGEASKSKASESFNQLSGIQSFPTLLFVDRSGIIRKVHSGFYGPGTGEHFKKQSVEFNRDIEELLRFNRD